MSAGLGNKTVCSAIMWAAFASILPLLIGPMIDGDLSMHFLMMQCFSEQFWQGDVHPRWCFEANAGLGSPVFLFYFPLPYYIAALFYPLTHAGLTLYGLYILLCYVASFATAYSCFSWLKDIVSTRCALLAALLFVLAPYRMEITIFRGAYAEMWFVALLPLALKYTRRLARGQRGALVPLAVVCALILLTHIPCSAIALLFCGVYCLAATGRAWKPKLWFAASVLWAVAMALFYIAPAAYYSQFLAPEKLVNGLYGWPNGHMGMANVAHQTQAVAGFALTVLMLVFIWGYVAYQRRRIPDRFVRREIMIWAALAALAFYLLIPASMPLYALAGSFSKILFPWRMQVIFAVCLAYMAAIAMQWCVNRERRQSWKMEFSMVLALLLLLGLSMGASPGAEAVAYLKKIQLSHAVRAAEYRTQWTDKAYADTDYILARHDNPDRPPRAQLVSGEGTVDVTRWSWRGIELRTQSAQPLTLRLDHSYFPVWQATDDEGQPLPLSAEEHTGLMLMNVPSGTHHVTIRYSAYEMDARLRAAGIISIFSALMCATIVLTRRFTHAMHSRNLMK